MLKPPKMKDYLRMPKSSWAGGVTTKIASSRTWVRSSFFLWDKAGLVDHVEKCGKIWVSGQ